MYAPTPAPDEIASWQTRRNSARSQYLQGVSQVDYNRGQADLTNTANMQRFGITFGRRRDDLPGQYAQRGLLNSGVYGRGLQQYAQDYALDQGDINRGYQQQLGQFSLDRSGLESSYNDTLLGINSDEQARRAAIAAALRSIL